MGIFKKNIVSKQQFIKKEMNNNAPPSLASKLVMSRVTTMTG